MDSLNTILNSGTYGENVSRHNDNNSKIKQAITTLENVAIANKGYFDTLASLQAAFPSPKAGNIAYVANVASSTGYYIYNVVSGVWTATTTEAPAVDVAISNYAQHGYSSIPKTLKQVDDEVFQLAGTTTAFIGSSNLNGFIKEAYIIDHDPAKTYFLRFVRKGDTYNRVAIIIRDQDEVTHLTAPQSVVGQSFFPLTNYVTKIVSGYLIVDWSAVNSGETEMNEQINKFAFESSYSPSIQRNINIPTVSYTDNQIVNRLFREIYLYGSSVDTANKDYAIRAIRKDAKLRTIVVTEYPKGQTTGGVDVLRNDYVFGNQNLFALVCKAEGYNCIIEADMELIEDMAAAITVNAVLNSNAFSTLNSKKINSSIGGNLIFDRNHIEKFALKGLNKTSGLIDISASMNVFLIPTLGYKSVNVPALSSQMYGYAFCKNATGESSGNAQAVDIIKIGGFDGYSTGQRVFLEIPDGANLLILTYFTDMRAAELGYPVFNFVELSNILLEKGDSLLDNAVWSWWTYPILRTTGNGSASALLGYTDTDSNIGVIEKKMNGGEISRTVIPTGLSVSADDHNAAAVEVLSNGDTLACFSTSHNNNNKFCVALKKPNGSFNPVILTMTNNVTYSQILEIGGVVYVFFRHGSTAWSMIKSNDFGQTWTSSVDVISGGTNLLYCIFRKTEDDRIRIVVYNHPSSGDTVIRGGFLDLVSNTVLDESGAQIGTIGTAVSISSFTPLITPQSGHAFRLFDAVKGGSTFEILYCDMLTSDFNNDGQYKLYSNGTTIDICSGGKAFHNSSHYYGGAVFGISKNEIYISRYDKVKYCWCIERYLIVDGNAVIEKTIRRSKDKLLRPVYDNGVLAFQSGYYNENMLPNTFFNDLNMEAYIEFD